MKHQQSCSSISSSTQSGFTLVDLTVVMMILGIMAASALPGLIDLTKDARVATVNNLEGGFRSAIDLLQARYIATENGKPIAQNETDISVNNLNLQSLNGNEIGNF